MDNETAKAKINDILNSDEKIKAWGEINNVNFEMAKTVLANLGNNPEVGKVAKKFNWDAQDIDL